MNPTDAFVPLQSAEQLFQSAEATLLTPNGLDADKLAPVFGRLLTHDVDYADLYFQYSRSEGWSLEEGQVKSGSFNIDQGVGVRAISGEKTAFAYSDDISLDALGAAADATRAIARAGQNRSFGMVQRGEGRVLYNPVDPLVSLADADKVALLERLEKKARAMDPRVIQVMASLASEYEVIFIARSDGHLAA
ncbi:MAG: metalloprotease TldD, partial [Proteobacteria bacterium]|nr:metalloprotease TldD [Pseudomonadota bacterium]